MQALSQQVQGLRLHFLSPLPGDTDSAVGQHHEQPGPVTTALGTVVPVHSDCRLAGAQSQLSKQQRDPGKESFVWLKTVPSQAHVVFTCNCQGHMERLALGPTNQLFTRGDAKLLGPQHIDSIR